MRPEIQRSYFRCLSLLAFCPFLSRWQGQAFPLLAQMRKKGVITESQADAVGVGVIRMNAAGLQSIKSLAHQNLKVGEMKCASKPARLPIPQVFASTASGGPTDREEKIALA